jgi:hypothetical protein
MPTPIILDKLTIPELYSLINTMNRAIDQHTGCGDCPPPLALIIQRDAAENELESRGA